MTLRLAIATLFLFSTPAAAQLGRGIPDEAVEATLDHYPETNERRHDLWYPSIEGRGGAFLGVGSDQCYSLAAAQGAEAIFLVDYDPVVSRIHRALGALIRRCDDADCLRERLTPAAEEESARLIAEDLGSGWEAQQAVRTFLAHRPLLARRIDRLRREDNTWVSRPAWYAHMHRAFAEGRVVARTADLRGPSTIQAMAQAARRANMVFEVLYLSNAEEYFSYNPSFVANLEALPVDDSAIILRTLRDQRLARAPGDHAWHYGVEPLSDLLRRITREGYRDSSWIVRDLLAGPGREPLSTLDASSPLEREAGPHRWWLEPGRPRPIPRARGESRLLRTFARSIRPSRPVDLADTGLADYAAAAFPVDPRTGERYRLSGEPTDAGPANIGAPEDSLLALLVDAVVREVLPPMFGRAGMSSEAQSLVRAPAVADLYGAYRMRERLLEICPNNRRDHGDAEIALRACRAATRLVQPVATRRAQPTWGESEGRIAASLRSLSQSSERMAPGDPKLVETLERLAVIARRMSPAR